MRTSHLKKEYKYFSLQQFRIQTDGIQNIHLELTKMCDVVWRGVPGLWSRQSPPLWACPPWQWQGWCSPCRAAASWTPCPTVSARDLVKIKIPSRSGSPLIGVAGSGPALKMRIRIRIQVYKSQLNTELFFILFVKMFFLTSFFSWMKRKSYF